MSRRSVFTVTIGTSHIECGDVSPPRVGSIIEMLLDFVDSDDLPPEEATTAYKRGSHGQVRGRDCLIFQGDDIYRCIINEPTTEHAPQIPRRHLHEIRTH